MRFIKCLVFILIFIPLQIKADSKLATADVVGERQLLELLDEYIDKRDMYCKRKEDKIDQLKLKLRMADSDTLRLVILNDIYREYYTYRYDSAMVYANRGLALSKIENNDYYIKLNLINKYVITKGIWIKVGKIPIREDLQVLPLRFVYDRISEKFFTYNPETGETAPTTIDVAKKLERAAVWDDKQIEERIKNHYDGVPCKWLQETFELFNMAP